MTDQHDTTTDPELYWSPSQGLIRKLNDKYWATGWEEVDTLPADAVRLVPKTEMARKDAEIALLRGELERAANDHGADMELARRELEEAREGGDDVIERAARTIYEGFFSTQPLRYVPWDQAEESIKDNNRLRACALADAGLLEGGQATHRALASLRDVLAIHRPAPGPDEDGEQVCWTCRTRGSDWPDEWPCETARIARDGLAACPDTREETDVVLCTCGNPDKPGHCERCDHATASEDQQ